MHRTVIGLASEPRREVKAFTLRFGGAGGGGGSGWSGGPQPVPDCGARWSASVYCGDCQRFVSD